MKKLSLFSLLTFIFIFNNGAFAQYGLGEIKDIEAIEKRNLIVMIEEPNNKVINKLGKKPKLGTVVEYKADLELYNENIKKAIAEYWPYNAATAEYMTFKQILALKKKGNKKYTVVYCVTAEAGGTHSGFDYSNGLEWDKDIKKDFEDRKQDNYTHFVVNLIEKFEESPVYYTPLYDIFPSKGSLINAIANTKGYFENRLKIKKSGEKVTAGEEMNKILAENAPQLEKKTLLIKKEWLDKELTEAKIKELYPYEFKICSGEEMEQAILSKDKTKAYFVILPYVITGSRTYHFYFHYVFNCENSELMCYVQPPRSAMLTAGYSGKAGNKNLTIKVLKRIVEQIKGNLD